MSSKSKPSEVPAGYPPASPSFSGSVYQETSSIPATHEVQNQPGFYGVSNPTRNWGAAVSPSGRILKSFIVETGPQELKVLLTSTTVVGVMTLILLFVDTAVAFCLTCFYIAITNLILLASIPVFWFLGVRKLVNGTLTAFLSSVIFLLIWKLVSFVLVCILLKSSRFQEFDITVVLAAVEVAGVFMTIMWLYYVVKVYKKLSYTSARRQENVGTGVGPANVSTPTSMAAGNYGYDVDGDAVVLGKMASTS